MGFAESIAQQQATSRRCKLQQMIDALGDNDRQAYEDAVAAGVSHRKLSNAFKENDMNVGPSAIGNHLNGVCACR